MLSHSAASPTRCALQRIQTLSIRRQSTQRPFDKVLIANRGEIVERVMRTCQALDIATVAVHSTVDAKSRFVRMADEAYCIGPASASESYLNTAAVLEAIETSGAQAVHPGYGFLSENASFCEAVSEKAVFLGPSPQAIRQLGDKLESKKLALEAGVHVVPGYEDVVETVEQALELSNGELGGYPVLLKAAAGGGGKGMRVCWSDQDIREAWSVSKAEALKFFMDDRLLIEKFIERPHHIEFQVISALNSSGDVDVVVFPERECSIQRRNQKIIEETPSVLLHESTRLEMAEQVRRLCRLVKYESAGTVEFLVDEKQHFYFLEMNTRLQVEHPVTEAVCNDVDLVKAMIWVGSGFGLPEELRPYTEGVHPSHGHSIEARIYAEDPLRGFLPSIGPLTKYSEPSTERISSEPYIRIDSGVECGHIVTPHYDPMLSKLVSFAHDRTACINVLSEALDTYVIEGVEHNAQLVQELLRNSTFIKGDTPTSFLDQHYPDGFQGVKLSRIEESDLAISAAIIDVTRRTLREQAQLSASDNDNELVIRMGGMFGSVSYHVSIDMEAKQATILEGDETRSFIGEGRAVTFDCEFSDNPVIVGVSVDNKFRNLQVVDQDKTGEYTIQMHGARRQILVQSPREYELSVHMKEPPVVDTSDKILSPMPGTLVSFAVEAGDEVEAGQEICVIEAMKMQNIIRSSRSGKIDALHVDVGAALKADESILQFCD